MELLEAGHEVLVLDDLSNSVRESLNRVEHITGSGVSVLEMIRAFEAASGRTVPFRVVARRPGDIAQCYADPAYALERLGWRAELSLDAMLRDTWRWQSQNPDGYDKS